MSTREMKKRIRSMESTRQITRAMEMVAASKLRKAQNQMISSRPYYQTLCATIHDIMQTNRNLSSPYLVKRPSDKCLYVVIGGDRGLAGGYNSNVLKAVHGKNTTVLPIGKRAVEYFGTHGYAPAEDVSAADCFAIAKDLCNRYLKGEYGKIYVVYTDFVSILSQVPRTRQLLPLLPQEDKTRDREIVYEPDSESVFAAIIPQYVGGMIYGALCESRASEQAARRTAMDAATSNANEMIDRLSLQYNRARQTAITQEITEIVAGSQ